MVRSPFFGFGNGEAKSLREEIANIKSNSVGLLSLVYTYRLIFFGVYIIKFKRGLDSMFAFKSMYLHYFFIMFMTQGFYYLPVFIIFLYQWPEKNEF
ncbi:hypothetical protein VL03_22055 [Rossellomorea marisflavi]|nr:hypothetical protein VL03_22055 [Rossellomorea marisflavi]